LPFWRAEFPQCRHRRGRYFKGRSRSPRNVSDYGLGQRLTLHRGDLFKPLGNARYDLIISNPPYVDAEGMAGCRANAGPSPNSPSMAAPAGSTLSAHLDGAIT
jgi:hypothetical protein